MCNNVTFGLFFNEPQFLSMRKLDRLDWNVNISKHSTTTQTRRVGWATAPLYLTVVAEKKTLHHTTRAFPTASPEDS